MMPWAKLITSITPNTSVRPAPMRAYRPPARIPSMIPWRTSMLVPSIRPPPRGFPVQTAWLLVAGRRDIRAPPTRPAVLRRAGDVNGGSAPAVAPFRLRVHDRGDAVLAGRKDRDLLAVLPLEHEGLRALVLACGGEADRALDARQLGALLVQVGDEILVCRRVEVVHRLGEHLPGRERLGDVRAEPCLGHVEHVLGELHHLGVDLALCRAGIPRVRPHDPCRVLLADGLHEA